jgi:hypothetical protein
MRYSNLVRRGLDSGTSNTTYQSDPIKSHQQQLDFVKEEDRQRTSCLQTMQTNAVVENEVSVRWQPSRLQTMQMARLL